MSIKVKLRQLHRKITPWFFPSLLFIATTGLTYRVGRVWFGMEKETGGKVLDLHSGEWLGGHGSVVYLLLVGGALLFFIISGLWMIFTSRRSKMKVRLTHRLAAAVVSLPLIVSAITGISLQAGEKWFNISESSHNLLLSLHQGTWLGNDLRAYYILLIGIGLIILCLTGLRMVIRKKSPQKT
jgi:uncharacterized iron-regulated membrane protein